MRAQRPRGPLARGQRTVRYGNVRDVEPVAAPPLHQAPRTKGLCPGPQITRLRASQCGDHLGPVRDGIGRVTAQLAAPHPSPPLHDVRRTPQTSRWRSNTGKWRAHAPHPPIAPHYRPSRQPCPADCRPHDSLIRALGRQQQQLLLPPLLLLIELCTAVALALWRRSSGGGGGGLACGVPAGRHGHRLLRTRAVFLKAPAGG